MKGGTGIQYCEIKSTREDRNNLIAKILKANPKNADVLDRLLGIGKKTIVQLSCSSKAGHYEAIGRVDNSFVDYDNGKVPQGMRVGNYGYIPYRHIRDFRILAPVW